MLGGVTYRVNKLTPGLAFGKAQRNMPEANEFVKIIPWDDEVKDFVYDIVTEDDFDGKMHPLELK